MDRLSRIFKLIVLDKQEIDILKKITFFIKENLIIIAFIFSIILTIVLRYKGLTFQSHWFDELFSARLSNPAHSFSTVYQQAMSDVHPPFYPILLWLWYHLVGFSEFSGRALAMIIGTLGIFFTYLLGKELYNKEVGIYSSYIAATNYFLIYYAQEVRSNILLYLFSVLSYLYFIRLLGNYTTKNLFYYILFSILLMYTHYFGFFLVASQVFVFLYYLIKDKEKRKFLLKLSILASLLMLFLLIPLFQRILEHMHTDGYWMETPKPLFFFSYMKAFVLSPFLHKIFFALLLLTFIYMYFDKKYKSSTIILFIWVVIGFLLPYIKSVSGFSILIERNMIIVIPALIVLIAYGIYLLKNYWIKGSLLVIIIFFALYHIYRMEYYEKITKDQFRETLQNIVRINHEIPVFDFIYGGKTFKTQASMLNIKMDFQSLKDLKILKKKKKIPSCFWVAHGHIDSISDTNILKTKGMQKVMTIENFQAQAFLYAYKVDSQDCLKDKNE